MKEKLLAILLSVILITGCVPVSAMEGQEIQENTGETVTMQTADTEEAEEAEETADTSDPGKENEEPDSEQNPAPEQQETDEKKDLTGTMENPENSEDEPADSQVEVKTDEEEGTDPDENFESQPEKQPDVFEETRENSEEEKDVNASQTEGDMQSEEKDSDDWLEQLKFAAHSIYSDGDALYRLSPEFSPEIHEYTLYFPDFAKGIFGLGVSQYSEPVMSSFTDCKGEKEAVNLNAYVKYGNFQAMDYIVDYGPGENTMRIYSRSGTKDYLVHVKRILSLGALKASYQGTDYVLYNHEREELFSDWSSDFQKEYDLYLSGDTKDQLLSLFPVTYFYKYVDETERKIYQVTVNGVETPTDQEYAYTMKGGDEDIEIRLSYEGAEDTIYILHVHPVLKQLDMTFTTDSENAGDTFRVQLYDQYGAEITGNIEDSLTFTGLLQGNKYSYVAYADGYKRVKGEFTVVEEEDHINISFSEKASGHFLEELNVNTREHGNSGGEIKNLVRHEELDQEFGGITYTVDYSNLYSSDYSFFVSAKLSVFAPEGAEAVMSAVDLDGKSLSRKMLLSSDDVEFRNGFQGAFFKSGEYGAKRGVWTLTVGNGRTQEIYKIVVNRFLELSNLSCSDSSDGDSVFNEKRFARSVHDYTVSVTENVKQVFVKASLGKNDNFDLSINGMACKSEEELVIPLENEITVISVCVTKEATYADPDLAGKTYLSEGVYTITVARSVISDITFQTDPEDAAVCVYDSLGNRVLSALSTPKVFTDLKGGTQYSYTVSCYGFKNAVGTFTAKPNDVLNIKLERCDTKHTELTDNEWWNYRNSEENNGVTSVGTPNTPKETSEKWSLQIGGSWNESCTPPLILGGQLYTGAGKYIYKIDRETGKILAVSDQLKGSLVFALNPLTYAEGMIFAQIGNGQIQAVDATTLKSVWISEALGGQTLSPITYKDGYIYTGTWNSESKDGTYFCLSITDEDPNNPLEIKKCTWRFSHKGGFYWAGSYATDKYVVFGSDDGSKEGDYTASSTLYSVSSRTGLPIDTIQGLQGDIRTSIVYDNGYIYFATKGGVLYRVKMNTDGTFGQSVAYNLGGMATASPVVYNGRIYIGVCGTGGQFQEDAGHHFDVLNDSANGITLAYSVPIRGYPQAGATLSTAYENEDYNGDGKPDGRVYIYFTYNVYPGGISFFSDEPGQTEGKAEDLFIPEKKQQQYCISTICADSDGTLYYKNDSGYLMAISSNSAYVDDIDVTCSEGKIKWDDDFSSSKGQYTLTVPDGTKEVSVRLTIPAGRNVSVNGQQYTGKVKVPLNDMGEGDIQVVVEYNKQKRSYKLKVIGLGSNADLSTLVVSDNNSVNITASHISITPAFSKDITEYTADVYTGTKKFLNLFAKADGIYGKVSAKAGEGTRRIMRFENTAGTYGMTRFAVYFDDQSATAEVTLKVLAGDGVSEKEYHIVLRRTDSYPPVLTNTKTVRIDQDHAQISFESNENGYFYLKAVEKGAEAPAFELSEPGKELLKGNNICSLDVPGGGAKDIYIFAVDSFGNKMEAPIQLELKEYKVLTVQITVVPADAQVTVHDDAGNIIPVENGSCTLFPGNHYSVTASKEGYYTKTLDITASEETKQYEIQLESSRSSDSSLKNLYVSSSDKYGKGMQKLTPSFEPETYNYQVEYNGERSHLNLWPEVSDAKASVKVYALGGIKSTTVSREDESIEMDRTGRHPVCKIYFEKQIFEAAVRVSVTAEDGTRTDYFVKLYIKDTTAPILKAVSVSRISEKRASVIFKSGEKGRYYYKVTQKGGNSQIDTSGKGVEGVAGTNIITLKKLTAGEKEIYIVMKDAAGNFSKILTISIPDSRKSGSSGEHIKHISSGTTGRREPGGQQSSAYIRNSEDSVEEGSGVLKKMNKTSTDPSENSQERRGTVLSEEKKVQERGDAQGEKSKKKSTVSEGKKPEKSEEKTKLESKKSGIVEQRNKASGKKRNDQKESFQKQNIIFVISLAGGFYLLFWIRACMVNRTKTAWKRRRKERKQIV